MRVLLTGANGFIGSAVLARLKSQGHAVVAVTRRSGADLRRLQADDYVTLDFADATDPEDWLPHLAGVDAVVNCAGLLQDAPGSSTEAVHRDGAAALFAACERAGVKRVVQVSAIGADRRQPTAFSRTKHEGDMALMTRDLDWVIVRPSVVVGRAAYGGSALLRGLAALPVLPSMPHAAPLQIVQLDDVASAILSFLRNDAPSRLSVDLAGPQSLTFNEAVLTYRRWLGWPPPSSVAMPAWLSHLATKLGDAAGALGWRPPIRSTAERELAESAGGDAATWREMTGIAPLALSEALAREPAPVQERWFARLYLLKALGFVVFAFFWIATGLITLGPGWGRANSLMLETGMGEPFATLCILGGSLADLVIGVAIAFRHTARAGLYAALGVSGLYLVAGTIFAPQLWADPLGALTKILPIMVLTLFLLAVLEDR